MLSFEEFVVLQVYNQLCSRYGETESDDVFDELLHEYAREIVRVCISGQDLSDEEYIMVENAEYDYRRFSRNRG